MISEITNQEFRSASGGVLDGLRTRSHLHRQHEDDANRVPEKNDDDVDHRTAMIVGGRGTVDELVGRRIGRKHPEPNLRLLLVVDAANDVYSQTKWVDSVE